MGCIAAKETLLCVSFFKNDNKIEKNQASLDVTHPADNSTSP